MSNNFETLEPEYLHKTMDIIAQMCSMQANNIPCAIPNLVGDGGIGKTASIRAMCKNYNLNLIDIHYGLKPLEEVSGIPDFSNEIEVNGQKIKNTVWTLPDILGLVWKVSQQTNHEKPNIIFLDDFHISSPGNMALGYEIFTEKKLRGYDFPPKSAFILAMNQSGSKSLANPIPAPIVNRLALFKVKPSFSYWRENFAIPNGLNAKILSFLNKDQYTKFFQEQEIVNEPWSSARAWTNLSAILNQLEKTHNKNLDFTNLLYLASSHVGGEASHEFSLYYKVFSEVNVKDIFDGKIEIEIPLEMSKRYIYIIACISEFIDRIQKLQKKDDDVKEIIENKKRKQLEAINIMSKIIINFSSNYNEMAVMALKEILIMEKNINVKRLKLYEKVVNTIKDNNSYAYDSIKTSIDLIGD